MGLSVAALDKSVVKTTAGPKRKVAVVISADVRERLIADNNQIM